MVFPVAFVVLSLLKLSAAVVCHFDASCTCTRDHPNLGEVDCSNTRVSLSRINASKLYSLALINNQIDYLPSKLFEGTGLYRFHLSHNAVYQLEEDVFSGVEYALWELHLTYCKLSAIPFKSIRHLQKLRTLNLTGNAILTISADQLRGVAASLQALILDENRLASLPDGVFSSLQSMEILSLRGNALTTLEPAAFTPPPLRLSNLDLSDNLLKSLNYRQLSNIRSLTKLDVSLNSISYLPSRNESFRLMLDSLCLDYNNITELETMSFVNFAVINKTSLKGNPLNSLQPNSFRPCRIEELFLTDCQLTNVVPEAFDGLDDTLKVLDLSGNNISTFKFNLLQKFQSLTSLRVDHNLLAEYSWLQPPGQKQPSNYQLLELSILGRRNAPLTMQKFPRLPHLHTLSISQTSSPLLDPEELNNFSVELETLKVEQGSLKSLNAGVFKHVRGIKTLDLTDNNIESVDALTFVEVSHSLEKLILVHSFTAKVGALPAGLLRPLSSLSLLKLNHNTLRKLPTDIRWISSLEILHAHDNIIDFLPNTLFESNAHKKLKEVILSFNKISKVQMGTFSDLVSLSKIDLSENEIALVEKGAFRNLEAVKRISLRGNRLSSLADEAFQNVRNLEYLDVSYNFLMLLSMSSFDQVGTYSSTMIVNASHNKIFSLTSHRADEARQFSYSSAIKVLDFSHNNISIVKKEYFTPIQDCLAQLIFSHNSIRNVSRDMLPNLPQLQHLDLSFNGYLDIEFDALRGLPYLQTFLINGNGLRDLPGGLFPSLNRLETLDFSNNGLTGLSDSFITAMSPILLDVSHNSLTRVPLTSFSQSHAGNVQQLILRSNKIFKLPSAESFARFSGLKYLDLTDNRLTDLGSSLSGLPSLTKLSVSYNRIRFDPNDWRGQERSLRHLDLSNTSLSYVPALPLPSLLTLKLSNNGIAYIPQDLQTNLTNLKMLDVSYNIIPELTPIPQLVYLNAAFNPINTISNSTFTNFLNLADLDIRLLPLTTFDEDALDQLPLITLAVSNYKQVERINIPLLVRENQALRHLIYEVAGTPSIGNEMQGMLPEKIRQLTLQGRDLKSVPHYLLQSIGRPAVLLTLRNTSVEALDSQLFRSPRLRNISLELMSDSLKTVGNPSNVARPNVPHSVFLIDMRLQSRELVCDCKLGWVETWARKKRQRTGTYPHSEDLRSSSCKNKQGKPFVDILKSDLECGWSGGIKCSSAMALIASTFVVATYVL